MTGNYRLGIDVGGTFTDAVLICESTGETHIAKTSTTPDNPAIGFLRALDKVLERAGIGAKDVWSLVHGTTVATNALIEGKTPKTAFLATAGFSDMLEIARQVRPTLYDLHFKKPRPLVPRDLAFDVPERLNARGETMRPLDEARVAEIAAELERLGVESVAICLLHSFLNPAHEERVAELLAERCPNLSLSLSSRVLPEFREYFRASTTVINACLRPVMARYLHGISCELKQRDVKAELLMMQSNGGVLSFEVAAEKPVYLVESGPAAGVIASTFIAEAAGKRDLLSLDMGGTTTKAGLILDGRPRVTKEYEVGAQAIAGLGQSRGSGYPIRTPVIDLVEIGAGGGSIAWVDPGNILRVGPQSAGAAPGPICYGKGGESPTITDANLVLGRINPQYFLGGEIALNVEAAAEGIRQCAAKLGMDMVAAANGIIEIANAAMINALQLVSVRRGIDARGLTLVAFGGASPLHANRLMAQLKIPLLIVPPSPGTSSALGLLVTDLTHVFSHTRIRKLGQVNADEVMRIFVSMEEQGRQVLSRDGVPSERMSFRREIEARYAGQSHEVAVACPAGPLTNDGLEAVARNFHAEHERTYGHGYPGETVEFVTFRLNAVGKISKPKMRELPAVSHTIHDAMKEPRQVFFPETRKFVETRIFDRYRLGPNHCFEGPAIVEEMDSTTVVHPGSSAQVDQFGNLLIRPIA